LAIANLSGTVVPVLISDTAPLVLFPQAGGILPICSGSELWVYNIASCHSGFYSV
jgi:hypothetical protein